MSSIYHATYFDLRNVLVSLAIAILYVDGRQKNLLMSTIL